jgi:hypothetical protein
LEPRAHDQYYPLVGLRRLLTTGGLVVLLGAEAGAQATSTIAGRISLPDGTPAPAAHVSAAVRRPDGSLRVVSETVATWDGRYLLRNVPAGSFLVSARRTRTGPATTFPGMRDGDPGQPVAVFAGVPTEGIDIWLSPAPLRYSVSGRMFWPGGQTVENLVIEYGDPRGERQRGIWYPDDPGGLFTIDGVSAGPLMLLARGETPTGTVIGFAFTDVYGPVEEVRLELERTGTVEGRVRFTRPLPTGAVPRVVLTHTRLRVSPIFPADASHIESDGRFRIAGVRGVYAVHVEGIPEGWRILGVMRDAAAQGGTESPVSTSAAITVGPGETVSGLVVTVGPSATTASAGGRQ